MSAFKDLCTRTFTNSHQEESDLTQEIITLCSYPYKAGTIGPVFKTNTQTAYPPISQVPNPSTPTQEKNQILAEAITKKTPEDSRPKVERMLESPQVGDTLILTYLDSPNDQTIFTILSVEEDKIEYQMDDREGEKISQSQHKHTQSTFEGTIITALKQAETIEYQNNEVKGLTQGAASEVNTTLDS
jgi:hypothetical protein